MAKPLSEVRAVSCEVRYHGFVYVDGGDGIIPGTDKVKDAYQLLRKPKKARKAHPLFARGFDTELTLRCSELGLKVSVKDEFGTNMIVMDHMIHKIAFVMNSGKSVLFLAKRRLDTTRDQFKCHGFETASSSTAKQLATHIVTTCNSVFRKLRKTRKQIRKRTEKEGKKAPNVQLAAPSTEEAARLRAELQAEVEAAKSYRQSLAVALSMLDEEEDDDDDEDEKQSVGANIKYEEYDDEFVKISLEVSKAAAENTRRILSLGEEGQETIVEDMDGEEREAEDVTLDSDEYLVSRAGTI
eukprot:m.116508 g.116508  ORF g.116508 m.116508 type:complete len:298 (+) comp14233_c0_seq1:169-1062(+)